MRGTWMATLLLLGFAAAPGWAGVDLAKIDRSIAKEPAYRSKSPRYCLLVFGPEAKTRIWLVLDDKALYVDRNGNGDLTEPGKRVEVTFTGQDGERAATVQAGRITAKHDVAPETELEVMVRGDEAHVYCTPKSGAWQGAGHDPSGRLRFATTKQEAPVLHFNGPLTILPDEEYTLKRGDATELYVRLGTPGKGTGTFTFMSYKDVPEDVHPIAEITFPTRTGSKTITRKVVLDHRC